MYEKRGYLLEITNRTPNKRTFQLIVDILARYRYNEFFVVRKGEVEEENVDWARLKAYCELQDVELKREAPIESTIMVSTEASKSLAGRVEEMRERMEMAERVGRERHCQRFLVTDDSDGYEWHPLAVSLPGIVMGGYFAFSGSKAANMDLERELNSVLDAPLAGWLLKLGTLYLRGGARRDDSSEYFNILAGDCGYSRHPGLTQYVLDEVSGIVRGVRVAAERWVERTDWAKEIVYMANLLDAACHRRDENRLRQLRDEHSRIWRSRYCDEGRVESMVKLPRF